MGGISGEGRTRTLGEKEKVIDGLYRQIGQLKVENEWLKKNIHSLSVDEKRRLIELDNKELSIRRQCELVGLQRVELVL